MVLSVNGISTYTTWQMATPTAIIMDEGVGTFLYKIFHMDEDIIVLNLYGTANFCFLKIKKIRIFQTLPSLIFNGTFFDIVVLIFFLKSKRMN